VLFAFSIQGGIGDFLQRDVSLAVELFGTKKGAFSVSHFSLLEPVYK